MGEDDDPVRVLVASLYLWCSFTGRDLNPRLAPLWSVLFLAEVPVSPPDDQFRWGDTFVR
jgi:hypothetical protein